MHVEARAVQDCLQIYFILELSCETSCFLEEIRILFTSGSFNSLVASGESVHFLPGMFSLSNGIE